MKTKNQKLLEEINEAFARNDLDFIIEHVTDTIRWEIVGDMIVEGKEAFAKALKEMQADEPMELTIHHIITHGKAASVNGEMKTAGGERYAFCDVYKFSGFKNPRITEMTSYVIAVKT
ncbi:nuclear transport factor 2 family protein [Halalkalibaculum sp. DA3122]|uniref:nuclear transport factor 2 family protein n=1 Tax=unclassified Halalkalibaculum TaxID=2964617 RepID=UPI0037546771